MAKHRKQAIFIGGPVHPDEAGKKKLAETVRRIEKLIEGRGLTFHPHLLADTSVYRGVEHKAQDVKVGKQSFDKLMKGVAKPQVRRLKKARWFETEDKLNRCAAVGSLVESQIAASIAGIFILSESSQGSGVLIGELLGRSVPVLVVSDQNVFGTVLTGHPSDFLQTARYESPSDLETIVGEFLDSLEGLELKPTSVRLPKVVKKRAEQQADEAGVNFNELVIRALNEYAERREEAEE